MVFTPKVQGGSLGQHVVDYWEQTDGSRESEVLEKIDWLRVPTGNGLAVEMDQKTQTIVKIKVAKSRRWRDGVGKHDASKMSLVIWALRADTSS